MENKGVFTVLKRGKKNIIVYVEKGETTFLDEYSFDRYDDAEEYKNNHMSELDRCVTRIKETKQREIQRKVDEELAKENKKKEKKAEKARKKEERKENRKQFWANNKKLFIGGIAGFLAGAITLVGGHFIAVGVSSLVDSNKDKEPSTSQEGNVDPTQTTNPVKNDPFEDINDMLGEEEELTQENFETLVADFSKPYVEKGINVKTEDLAKFVSIININKLAEENPELAANLFGTETKEVYLVDAANIIGMTYTYNRNVFEQEGNTLNFIRISNAVSGNQKTVLQIVEGYVDKIALVKDNPEEVNKLIAELLVRLGDPESDLSYVDDGVGFGMQVSIELIRSYLAKDVISKENFDMLTTLVPSDQYVSNIFTVYDKCTNTHGLVRE